MSKILIVDDDRNTVRLLRTLLELDGFEVGSAVRGEEALEVAHEFAPDLFMVDYHLTDMTGVELTTRLRGTESFAYTPIVLASGLDKEDEALAAGANLFLVKPLEPDQLAATLYKLLG